MKMTIWIQEIAGLAIMRIIKHVINPSLDQVVHTFIRQLDIILGKQTNQFNIYTQKKQTNQK